jgi:hypothetical protein
MLAIMYKRSVLICSGGVCVWVKKDEEEKIRKVVMTNGIGNGGQILLEDSSVG